MKSGGLLIYIVGAQLKNGGNMFLDSGETPVKEYLYSNCTLLDAYRLPDSIFERTGVTSDINGDFLLKAPTGTYTLDCSMIGYKNQKQSVTILAGDTLKLNFKLSDANTMLEEVVCF